MDVIYTDRNLNDEGCLHHYNIDLDIANEKNFEITVGIKNNVMHSYVISSITNIIVKLDDDTVDISYSVGDATRKG